MSNAFIPSLGAAGHHIIHAESWLKRRNRFNHGTQRYGPHFVRGSELPARLSDVA